MIRDETTTEAEEQERTVPESALLVSLLALVVPVVTSITFPSLATTELGLLIWLTALVPPFLLTYHRAWRGASMALAAGMAALSLSQVVLVLRGSETPSPDVLLWLISVLIGVSLGSGWLAERLHSARREAESMAFTDGLTGLANRRHLTVFLDSAFSAAERGVPLAVVLFDLDRFKQINDEHGHAQGDRVIRRFGRILEDSTREMNLTGRWGGEEFLSVLSGTDEEGAEVFAERVRVALEQTTFRVGRVTVSAGVAGYQPEMANPEVLVAAADQALYRAKTGGRNRVARAETGGAGGETDATGEERDRSVSTVSRLLALKDDESDVPPRGEGEVLLVVDDDRAARRSVGRALARFGYHVLEAAGPEEALEIARGRNEPIDLVVTDVIMPSMSGFRLIEILQEESDELRVVYISGYTQEDVEWEGAPGAVRTFLSKPMSIERLVRVVRRVLDRPIDPVTASSGDASGPETRAPEAAGAAPESRARGTMEPVTTAHDPIPGGEETVPAETSADPSEAPEQGSVPEELRDAHILVVDDEPDVARSFSLLLRRCGFREVRATTDPGDIPVLLARFRPDLVLLDLHMPGIGGTEVLEALRDFDEGAYLPVIVITGDVDPEAHRKALAAGAADFLHKPVETWELLPRVENLLRIRFMNRELLSEASRLESRVSARTAELEEARTEILLRLARAAEYRDDVTGRHAERVGALAGLLAEAVGVPDDERDLIERAAPLHDVGKIGVPDEVLRKPGPLDDEEMGIMRSHPEIGAEILGGSRVPLLVTARQIALHHHERWNGSGYPVGLAKEEIPIEARVVTVADVFDSLTHDRPYRSALTPEVALDHLQKEAGRLYDPKIVDALLDLHRRGLVENAGALGVVRGAYDNPSRSAGAPRGGGEAGPDTTENGEGR